MGNVFILPWADLVSLASGSPLTPIAIGLKLGFDMGELFYATGSKAFPTLKNQPLNIYSWITAPFRAGAKLFKEPPAKG